jgi:hypothetical protein
MQEPVRGAGLNNPRCTSWLSAGQPHCADCHVAPYVEQSGNNNAYPPLSQKR